MARPRGVMTESHAYAAKPPKMPPKKLESINLKKAENGGFVAEHRFTHFEHPTETHAFGPGQARSIMQHLNEHLGIGEVKADSESNHDGTE